MGKRTSSWIGLVGIMILFAALAFFLGRQSAGPQPEPIASPVAKQTPANSAPAPKQAAETPRRDDSAGLRHWLAGGWAEVSSNCETDNGEHFNADGRYADYSSQGYWSVEGDRLTVRVTHELQELDEEPFEQWVRRARPTSLTTTLIRESDDRRVTISGGERIRMMRCPLSNFTFTIPVEG